MGLIPSWTERTLIRRNIYPCGKHGGCREELHDGCRDGRRDGRHGGPHEGQHDGGPSVKCPLQLGIISQIFLLI